jgi:acetyl esterase/lipase
MLYMVVERFKPGAAVDVYRRAREHGRLLPDGLVYVSSWVDLDFTTCFQIMETDDEGLFEQWMKKWEDLVEFEIIPVRTSAEALGVIGARL